MLKVACDKKMTPTQATHSIKDALTLPRRTGLGLGAALCGLQLLPGTGAYPTAEWSQVCREWSCEHTNPDLQSIIIFTSYARPQHLRFKSRWR